MFSVDLTDAVDCWLEQVFVFKVAWKRILASSVKNFTDTVDWIRCMCWLSLTVLVGLAAAFGWWKVKMDRRYVPRGQLTTSYCQQCIFMLTPLTISRKCRWLISHLLSNIVFSKLINILEYHELLCKNWRVSWTRRNGTTYLRCLNLTTFEIAQLTSSAPDISIIFQQNPATAQVVYSCTFNLFFTFNQGWRANFAVLKACFLCFEIQLCWLTFEDFNTLFPPTIEM